jgi:hypothetical protein
MQSSTVCLSASLIVDQVPLNGNYPARLAIEQLYGYMVRNGKVYGILTTMKGWCFLQRTNGGGLLITPMYGDFLERQNITVGAANEGYYPTAPNFTIMQALYYMSRLAEVTPDLPETPLNGFPGQVRLPRAAAGSTNAAPTIEQPQFAPGPALQGAGHGYYGQGGYQGFQVLGGYDQVKVSQYDKKIDYSLLRFEPWNIKHSLGPKTWIARVLPHEITVVLKLWDAWKSGCEDRDKEVAIYEHLQSLWGISVPFLRVSTPIEYFHALILQYVEVRIDVFLI